jgi:biuret amidohydrolase
VTPTATATGRVLASATPYPWPYHGTFDARRCALVACLDRGWRQDGEESDRADLRLAAIASALQFAGGLVITILATPVRRGYGSGTPFDSTGGGGLPITGDATVVAGATNAFHASALDDLLRRAGAPDLIVAGWGLEGPVHSTMRAANDRGYECLLVPDACTPIEPALVGAACSMVQFSGGIFGAWAPSDGLLDLLGTSPPHPVSSAGDEPTRKSTP